MEILASDVLEVKVAVEAAEPGCEGDEELCERRVDVHEEAAVDVLGSKAAKVDLVKDDARGLTEAVHADEERDDDEGGEDAMLLGRDDVGGRSGCAWLGADAETEAGGVHVGVIRVELARLYRVESLADPSWVPLV